MTSARIGAPGCRASTSRASTIISWSPHRISALAVDDADAVAVAVKGDAEIAVLARHRLLQLHQVRRHGRVGVMRRESAVDLVVDQDVAAGQASGQPLRDLAGGAVAGSQATVSGREPS